MFRKKPAPPKTDPGLQEIADWHDWFMSGHTARLADRDFTDEHRARELATITAQAAAIRDRMESDYRSRRQL
jgi:hypothetical protein